MKTSKKLRMLMLNGANDGARTRDNQNHNLGLYQLSYVRHRRSKIIALRQNPVKKGPHD